MPDTDAMVSHDPDGFHRCPAEGCDQKVPNTMAFCRRHWYAVPKPIRDEIWSSYAAGKAGTVGHIELINRAAEAIRG